MIAHSRREYRQFELAYNREMIKRNNSHDQQKSSNTTQQMVRPLSKKSKDERLIDVYSHGQVGAINLTAMTNNLAIPGVRGRKRAKSVKSAKSLKKKTRSQSKSTTKGGGKARPPQWAPIKKSRSAILGGIRSRSKSVGSGGISQTL